MVQAAALRASKWFQRTGLARRIPPGAKTPA
jgi:hypothetical protein